MQRLRRRRIGSPRRGGAARWRHRCDRRRDRRRRPRQGARRSAQAAHAGPSRRDRRRPRRPPDRATGDASSTQYDVDLRLADGTVLKRRYEQAPPFAVGATIRLGAASRGTPAPGRSEAAQARRRGAARLSSMLTAALPRSPARPGARWMPGVPALVERVLVVAAIAVLWPFFEQVAQLGGAGRDQRFLDRGIVVAGLPDAIVARRLRQRRRARRSARRDGVVRSRAKGRRHARRSTCRAPSRRRSRERARHSSARFATPSSARSRCAREAESGGAELREQADAIAAIESDLAPFRQRFQIASGDDAGPLPLRCAARWVDGALAARLPAGAEAATARSRRAPTPSSCSPPRSTAAPRRHRSPPKRCSRPRRSAASACPGGAVESLAATASLMADARQSLVNSRKNEAMRALVALGRTGNGRRRWRSATPSSLWSRRTPAPALAVAAALAAWAGAAWLGRVPWPLGGGHEVAFGRADVAWTSAPGTFVLAPRRRGGGAGDLRLARRPARARAPRRSRSR